MKPAPKFAQMQRWEGIPVQGIRYGNRRMTVYVYSVYSGNIEPVFTYMCACHHGRRRRREGFRFFAGENAGEKPVSWPIRPIDPITASALAKAVWHDLQRDDYRLQHALKYAARHLGLEAGLPHNRP